MLQPVLSEGAFYFLYNFFIRHGLRNPGRELPPRPPERLPRHALTGSHHMCKLFPFHSCKIQSSWTLLGGKLVGSLGLTRSWTRFESSGVECRTWKSSRCCSFAVLGKVEGDWPIARMIRNVIPFILVVLKPCETLPDLFR